MDDQPTRRLDAPDAPPQPSDRCPKCSGSRFWVRAIDRGHYNNVFDLCLQPFKARRSLFPSTPRRAHRCLPSCASPVAIPSYTRAIRRRCWSSRRR
jgi:hypothetical protein